MAEATSARLEWWTNCYLNCNQASHAALRNKKSGNCREKPQDELDLPLSADKNYW